MSVENRVEDEQEILEQELLGENDLVLTRIIQDQSMNRQKDNSTTSNQNVPSVQTQTNSTINSRSNQSMSNLDDYINARVNRKSFGWNNKCVWKFEWKRNVEFLVG